MLSIARRIRFIFCLPGLCLLLVLGDVVTMLVHWLLGQRASMLVMARLIEGTLLALRLLTATKVTVRGSVPTAPAQRPMILVANHQPPFDMILLALVFREHQPAFLMREGISRFIPLVSRYLRVTRSMPIDLRGRLRQTPRRIRALAEHARAHGSGVAIFPEGLTAWGEGAQPRPFRRAGLRRLLDAMPDARVVPVVFDGCDRLARRATWYDLTGTEVSLTILPALEPSGQTVDAVIDTCEALIHREQLRLLEQRERASQASPEPARVLPFGARLSDSHVASQPTSPPR